MWLPPDEGFNVTPPSLDDIRCVQVSLLAPSIDRFLFERLPKLLALQRESVDWHFNPLCQGCKFSSGCREASIEEGRLGSMPNISITDARALQELLNSAASTLDQSFVSSDIEDLCQLVSSPSAFTTLEKQFPVLVKKGRRILRLPQNRPNCRESALASPMLDAANTKTVQV